MAVALTPWWADAGWQTAIATWTLVVITALAVFFGWRAASAANETYALEAEPVIVVREFTWLEGFVSTDELKRHVSASTHYVVAGSPTLSDGVTLRLYADTDDPNFDKSGFVTQPPQRPTLVFAVQNVGRSPAVGIEIGWDLSMSVFVESPDRPYDRVGEERAVGYISLPAIAPQNTTYVRVENLLGVAVKLSVKPMGTQIDWRSFQRRKKKIAVIAAASDFTLKSP